MQDVEIVIEGSRVTLDFSRVDPSSESLSDRVGEVIPLLHALLSADTVWRALSLDELEQRHRGCLAISMLCQEAIIKATARAQLLREIASGTESAADHGFPEFAGGLSNDV